ncbi:endo alpha-1,4 polygalactosaminidase [Flavobacterium lacus]|uniref:Uncharacterized protein (TIGR01370 family) n=1 Tax=Flavobacterium lacus TaxID=1353778 RepID=A0A328WZ16_9FLAO|nr:endo alpha-1,4 polygalactosaminidase [Flavobacterium lacus]RAR48468.1 uncharacterized protein (TIGR01370 family) [Flavobacterium lacus]
MRRFNLFLWLLPSLLSAPVFSNSVNKSTVLVCYGKLDPVKIKGYNYVILEEKNFKKEEISLLKKNNKNVLAYISLGEVNSNAIHYNLLKNRTLGKNNNWNSYYLNLKDKSTPVVLMSLIKKVLDKGFDGLFLDNIDNFSSFGPQFSQRNDLIELIKRIKKTYPNHTLVQNSGLELIPDTKNFIDSILFESVATDFSFIDNLYKLRENSDFLERLKNIKKLSTTYKIPVLLIEYADNKLLYDQIIKRLSSTNFEYFIGKIDLQAIPDFSK